MRQFTKLDAGVVELFGELVELRSQLLWSCGQQSMGNPSLDAMPRSLS